MKEITREEMDLLFEKGILKSTKRGIIDNNGSLVSYNQTKHKRYIMDEYVNMAQNLVRGLHGKEKVKN